MTYDPALSDADAAPSYARALQACVGSLQALARPTATVFYRIDASGEPVDFELFGMTAAMHRAYVSRYRPLDPLHPSRCASQPGAVVTLASQLPDERRDTSSYWTGFLRRHGVVDVVEVLLRDGGAVLAAFSLLRLAGDGRYSVPEIAALRAVQPVVEAALLPPLRAVRGIRRIACDVRLTHREEQIARLVRDGRSNKGHRARSRARPADRQDASVADVSQARRIEPDRTRRRAVSVTSRATGDGGPAARLPWRGRRSGATATCRASTPRLHRPAQRGRPRKRARAANLR
ncbi:LuxR family transcriptional regulator [Burkholderia pseudomallei]|nr:LuxR family transcriptional regulator [Burkholderia pseudomallei]VBR80064.1 LuxR family transcriptional regulator [Burkholderia pseudomallei]